MRYITLDQSFRLNARRHWQRGYVHSLMGRPDYACGSYRKAMKWEKRADAIACPFPGFASMVLKRSSALKADMEEILLNGR